MRTIFLHDDALSQFLLFAVDDDFLEPLVQKIVEHLVVLAFASHDHGRLDAYLRLRDVFCQFLVGILLGGAALASRIDDVQDRFEDLLV